MAPARDAEGFAAYAAEAGLTIETREGLTLADLLRFSVPTDAIDGAAAGDVVSGVTNTGFNIVLVRDARARSCAGRIAGAGPLGAGAGLESLGAAIGGELPERAKPRVCGPEFGRQSSRAMRAMIAWCRDWQSLP